MTIIGIIGAGEVGAQLARAAIRIGHHVVIANSRDPETLRGLVDDLGPRARAAHATDAASAGDVVVLAYPWSPDDVLPVEELAGKVVIDTNNYMAWRDGHHRVIDHGEKTVHELRQEQLPASQVVKAFTHVQAPSLFRLARPAGSADRQALVVSSDHPDAVQLVTGLYDQIGFDAVDNSPLSQSWRSTPGTPMWHFHDVGQSRDALVRNLQRAERPRR